MTLLLILTAATVTLVFYLRTGFGYAAPLYVERHLARVLELRDLLRERPELLVRARESAQKSSWLPAIFWPIYLSLAPGLNWCRLAMNGKLGQELPSEVDLLHKQIEVLTKELEESRDSLDSLLQSYSNWKDRHYGRPGMYREKNR